MQENKKNHSLIAQADSGGGGGVRAWVMEGQGGEGFLMSTTHYSGIGGPAFGLDHQDVLERSGLQSGHSSSTTGGSRSV